MQSVDRAEAVLAYRPHVEYAMGSGPSEPSQPWHDDKSDCSSFGCYCVGVAKHDPLLKNVKGERIWWGTAAIESDATGPRRRWRALDIRPGMPAPVGAMVVYGTVKGRTGHCGIVTGGTYEQPRTIECRGGRGVSRVLRPVGFWMVKKNSVFVVPVEKA